MSGASVFEKDGSVLEWLREQDPERGIEFVAIEQLTDAPATTRQKYIEELAEEIVNSAEDPGTVREVKASIIGDIGYIAGFYEPAGYRQKIYKAWQETDPDIEHPIFHQALYEYDVSKIARDN